MSAHKVAARQAKKTRPGVAELMNQGVTPKVALPEKSVKGLLKQGAAPSFPGQGHLSVRSLMKQ